MMERGTTERGRTDVVVHKKEDFGSCDDQDQVEGHVQRSDRGCEAAKSQRGVPL